MNVVYFIAYPQRIAGANRSLFELVTHLPPHVHPTIVAAAEGEATRAYRDAGIDVRIVPPGAPLQVYGRQAFGWSTARKAAVALRHWAPYQIVIWKLLGELRADLVHVNDPRGAFLIGPAARMRGLPLIGHLRGEKPYGGPVWQVFEKLSTHIISVSDGTAAGLAPSARAKTTTVYNGTRDISAEGMPMRWLQALREDGVVVVCCFASVCPFKGQHHLLDAIAKLNERGWRERAVFICVGDLVAEQRSYCEWLRQKQMALGVTNLTFAGWQSNPFSFYKSIDICVLPSVSRETLRMGDTIIDVQGCEGFPRTFLEAMSFGLPVVGTDISGVREQVADGVTGFVVPPGDADALAAALERLLEDETLRRQMGAAGRARVLEKFTTQTYVDGVLDVYARVRGQG